MQIKTVTTTMIDGQLQLLIISVLFQYLISAENMSCSTCMADIYGPYPENETIFTSVKIVTATESDPAVIVCRYQCYDQDYNFDLGIDILDPKRRFPIRRIIVYQHQEPNYDFTVIPNNVQTCNLSNNINETIRKYQIHVGSSSTPTLIAKCFVVYSPNGLSRSTRCSSLSTLAIIPGNYNSTPDNSTHNLPTKTVSPSSYNYLLSITKTVTVTMAVPEDISDTLTRNNTNNNLQHIVFGSVLPVLAAAILIFFAVLAVYLCTKSKKCQCTRSKNSKDETKLKIMESPPQKKMAWSSSNPGNDVSRPKTA